MLLFPLFIIFQDEITTVWEFKSNKQAVIIANVGQ